MKCTDPLKKFFPCLADGGGCERGGLFCYLNQSCRKFHEMHRSWGGGSHILLGLSAKFYQPFPA